MKLHDCLPFAIYTLDATTLVSNPLRVAHYHFLHFRSMEISESDEWDFTTYNGDAISTFTWNRHMYRLTIGNNNTIRYAYIILRNITTRFLSDNDSTPSNIPQDLTVVNKQHFTDCNRQDLYIKIKGRDIDYPHDLIVWEYAMDHPSHLLKNLFDIGFNYLTSTINIYKKESHTQILVSSVIKTIKDASKFYDTIFATSTNTDTNIIESLIMAYVMWIYLAHDIQKFKCVSIGQPAGDKYLIAYTKSMVALYALFPEEGEDREQE